ncbi:MAG: class I SAM-dependent methyltransferase [bacterium]|nr:MAG: class I SAM-dependent methyltransferase [bacterium]
MKNPSGVDSKELGLAAGLVFARYFLKTEHLHYGYWTEDLEVDISNLRQAQDRYSDILLSHIPGGTRSILDVGCGTGVLSRRLLGEGYEVQSVSPSPFLTSYARDIIGQEAVIHECTFEDLHLDRKFDLILFAESFQYIDLKRVFPGCRALLTGNGHVLICDFFRRDDATGASGLGGGHSLGKFYERMSEAGFGVVIDSDITSRTAPNMDLVRDLLDQFGKPLWDLFLYFLQSNHPRLNWLARKRYRKRIDKIEGKYFSGRRNAETFRQDKSYRLVLCKPEGEEE